MLPKLPRKHSYPPKPVVLVVPFTGCKINNKFHRRAISELVPATGVVPFDWVTEECPATHKCEDCGKPVVTMAEYYFGYDSMAEANAVKARFDLVGRQCTVVKMPQTAQEAREILWVRYYGPIPEGQRVATECEDDNCVNPEHLKLEQIARQ